MNRNRQVPAEETPAFGGIAERFRRAGDLDRAIALCRDGLKRFPEQLSARVTLGWALLDKGQYDLARGELEQVLRKAPDNLAAIRGLAELHDRTEGALSSEHERSWKSDDTPAVAETAAPAEPPLDRLAPIPVTVTNTAAELMSTAAYAEQAAEAAASVFDPGAGSGVDPIEIEGPAAASMAAADLSPFSVGDPVETMAFDPGGSAKDETAPLEVATVEPVEIEFETAGAAALSGFDPAAVEPGSALSFDAVEVEDLTTLALESTGSQFESEPSAFDPGVAVTNDVHIGDDEDEIDWAGLTALTSDEPQDQAAVLAETAEAVDTVAAFSAGDGADADVTFGSADDADVTFGLADDADVTFGSLEADGAVDEGLGQVEQTPPVLGAPESLDDIDEAAGQDLADAIKALQDAARRVESRIAPRSPGNEPATSPEEIASYDFGSDSRPAEDEHAASGRPDTRQDGSFELVAPDLTDLSFGLGPSSGEATAAGESDQTLTLGTDEASVPSLDFDAEPVVTNTIEDAVEPSAVEAVAGATDIAIEDVGASGGAPVAELAGADVLDVVETVEVFETVEAGDVEHADLPETREIPEPMEVADAGAVDGGFDASEAEIAGLAALIETPDDGEVGVRIESEVAVAEEVESEVSVADVAGDAVAEEVQVAEAPDVAVAEEVEFEVAVAVSDEVESEVTAAEEAEFEVAVAEEVESDVEVAEVAGDAGTAGAPADAAEEDLPLAAMVATDLTGPTATDNDLDTATLIEPRFTEPSVEPSIAATVFAPATDPVPAMHVYDAPVLAATSAVAAEVAALAASDDAPAAVLMAGQVQTSVRSQLAALERFLSKVQARQLELRGETVA